jgi:hypothetical protein
MNLDEVKTAIQAGFPGAETARLFYAKQNIILEEQYGFTPGNTRFAEGGCSDEINEPEYQLMAHYWGERFKFGGLAGYCHGGKTGLAAVSHHVPREGDAQNLLLAAGAHIGYHEGRWGRVPRPGQSGLTASCGSLNAVVEAGYEIAAGRPQDPLDLQQRTVAQVMRPYLEQCAAAGRQPELVAATRFMMERIDADLMTMVADLAEAFDGQIAVITGVTINTALGNFFSPHRVAVLA